MNINGIGIIFNRGRGLENLEKALLEGWKMPADGYTVPQEALSDSIILKNMRRADDLSKMVTIATLDAVNDGGLEEKDKEELGIILATAFGPHPTTFKFLDDIINFGEKEASPTTFSHSVHNAALSYAANLLQSRGPTLTITQFAESFYQAVILAESWLYEGRCNNVLVGAADQYGEVMKYICSKKLKISMDGKIKPFSFQKNPEVVPGEGCVFFLFSNKGKPKYASMKALSTGYKDAQLYILDTEGMSSSEEPYIEITKKNYTFASYTPIFGSMLTGIAFSCAVAALIIKNQTIYSVPIKDNPHKIKICNKTEKINIDKVSCIKFDCLGRKLEILVEKK